MSNVIFKCRTEQGVVPLDIKFNPDDEAPVSMRNLGEHAPAYLTREKSITFIPPRPHDKKYVVTPTKYERTSEPIKANKSERMPIFVPDYEAMTKNIKDTQTAQKLAQQAIDDYNNAQMAKEEKHEEPSSTKFIKQFFSSVFSSCVKPSTLDSSDTYHVHASTPAAMNPPSAGASRSYSSGSSSRSCEVDEAPSPGAGKIDSSSSSSSSAKEAPPSPAPAPTPAPTPEPVSAPIPTPPAPSSSSSSSSSKAPVKVAEPTTPAKAAPAPKAKAKAKATSVPLSPPAPTAAAPMRTPSINSATAVAPTAPPSGPTETVAAPIPPPPPAGSAMPVNPMRMALMADIQKKKIE